MYHQIFICGYLQMVLAQGWLLSSADIFANSLDSDQDQQNVGPDLDPNCLKLW